MWMKLDAKKKTDSSHESCIDNIVIAIYPFLSLEQDIFIKNSRNIQAIPLKTTMSPAINGAKRFDEFSSNRAKSRFDMCFAKNDFWMYKYPTSLLKHLIFQ